jgi:hypothetical protein
MSRCLSRLQRRASNAVVQMAGQHDVDHFDRIVREQFAIITHDTGTGMRLSRRGLRFFRMRGDRDELRARRFDNRPRVMAPPRSETNQREANPRRIVRGGSCVRSAAPS